MKKILFIFFSVFISSTALCQQYTDSAYFDLQYRSGIKYIFKTSEGTVFRGFVVNETRDFISVENREVNETYDLRKSEIVSAKFSATQQSYADVKYGDNEHARNYMLAQSAFLFKEGQASSTCQFLLLDNIDYGLSENWAFTANTFGFVYPVSVGLKCAYKVSDNNYFGAQVFGVGMNYSNYGTGIFGYGAIARYTKGTTNENFTATAGVIGLNSDVVFNTNAPFVNNTFFGVAYCRRMRENIAMNVEGWYMPTADAGLIGAAVKLVGNPVSCWTFGFYTLFTEKNNAFQLNLKTLPVPYVGVSRNF